MAYNDVVQSIANSIADSNSLGDILNGAPDTQVTTRLGRYIWTLATINTRTNSVIAQSDLAKSQINDAVDSAKSRVDTKIDELTHAINQAINASVGADGWPDQLVLLPNGRTQRDKNSDFVSVKDFGAKGDGVTDDTTALQNAINSGATLISLLGKTYLTNTLTLKAGVAIVDGALKLKTANTVLINAQANTLVDNVTLVGSGNTAENTAEILVKVSGSPTIDVDAVRVTNCTLKNSNGYAIRMDYSVDAICSGNKIENIRYAAIAFIGAKGARVYGNRIKGITGLVASANGYAITFSSDGLVKLADGGRVSIDCQATGNIIENVPTWNALDTHGGNNILFSGNVIRDAGFPIGVVASKKPTGEDFVAPKNIVVSNNLIEYTALEPNSKQNVGISIVGETAKYIENVSVTGNVLKRCGLPNIGIGGAIKVGFSRNVSVTGNTIWQPFVCGINIYSDNYGFTVSGNIVTDPHDNTIASPAGIRLASDNNLGVVASNTIYKSTNPPSSTYVAVTGISVSSTTSTDIVFGANYANTTNKVTGYAQAGMGVDLLVSELTDSTNSTANNTVIDVGATYNQSAINSNFAELTVKYNQLVRILERMLVAG